MVNPLKALTWRICGSYDPEGPVTEYTPISTRNRAKYEAWKYVTFGPGRDVCEPPRNQDLVSRIIEAGKLQEEPLHLNDPWEIAGLACIIAEMEKHNFLSIMTPLGAMKTQEDVKREESTAIDRFVCYLIPKSLPPLQYTEWHEEPHETLGWMNYYTPKRHPVERVIPRDAQKIRENYRRHFKEMLETLKKRNNQ